MRISNFKYFCRKFELSSFKNISQVIKRVSFFQFFVRILKKIQFLDILYCKFYWFKLFFIFFCKLKLIQILRHFLKLKKRFIFMHFVCKCENCSSVFWHFVPILGNLVLEQFFVNNNGDLF
jgi:hypothetical protein